MRDYLMNRLHVDVEVRETSQLYNELPLMYEASYVIYEVRTDGVDWIAIQPKMEIGLTALRKNRAFVEKVAQKKCAVFLDRTSFYSKEKMMQEGIPFVIQGKDIYLPFLGVLLAERRELKPVQRLSFLTQKILISGMYEGYDGMNATMLAKRFDVSKMAVSKCFDELEFLAVNVLGMKGKSRVLSMNEGKKELWAKIQPYLRSPIIRRFALERDIKLNRKAGMSALCEYSLLSDNIYPTYAVTKDELRDVRISLEKEVGRGTDPGCIVLELGYFLDPVKQNVQDPLSTMLSVTEERNDERVELSIESMLKEYVW